ncbi:hypothetical protein U1Q18_012873 [Sarracenia purpurea var. burkii]
MMVEAADVMSEMLIAGVKSTLRTYSALIGGYANAGKQVEAEEIKPFMRFFLLQALRRENKQEDVQKVVNDMEESGDLDPQNISSVLVKGQCYDHAAKLLRKTMMEGKVTLSSSMKPTRTSGYAVGVLIGNKGYGRAVRLMPGMFRSIVGCDFVKKPNFLLNMGLHDVFYPKGNCWMSSEVSESSKVV